MTAPADGYTLLLAGPANVISMALYDKLNFNFTRDIAPIASIVRFPFVMEVHPSVPTKTLAEFMAYTKANPGKVNMASAGTGSGSHLTGELFKMMTGLNILHVPYRGSGPALIDLIGGQGNAPQCFPRSPVRIEHLVRSASRHSTVGSVGEAAGRLSQSRSYPGVAEQGATRKDAPAGVSRALRGIASLTR